MTQRERLSKKELEGLVSSLQAQVVSLEARNSSVQSPRRPSTSRSPQRDRSGSVSLSPQRGMRGIDVILHDDCFVIYVAQCKLL